MGGTGRDYHDYVFRDGRLVGRFEDMYREADGVPWHQDRDAWGVFADLDVTILRHFHRRFGFESVCDAGCGLGYVTARIKAEALDVAGRPVPMTGFDISSTAAGRAAALFPHIEFAAVDLLKDDLGPYRGRFDLVMAKELIWYVVDDADEFFRRLGSMARRFVYLSQCFPESADYYGKALFPNAAALEAYVGERFDLVYSVVEKDSQYHFRELVHILARVRG